MEKAKDTEKHQPVDDGEINPSLILNMYVEVAGYSMCS